MGSLETLKQDIDSKNLQELCNGIVKYQNFKTRKAMQLISHCLAPSTCKNYFESGVAYIKTGIKRKGIRNRLYDFLDIELNKHTQPLTPSHADKRVFRKNMYHKKEVKLPVCRMDIMQNPVTAPIKYGVQVGDYIRVFEHKDHADLFSQGVKFGGGKAKVVTIEDMEE